MAGSRLVLGKRGLGRQWRWFHVYRLTLPVCDWILEPARLIVWPYYRDLVGSRGIPVLRRRWSVFHEAIRVIVVDSASPVCCGGGLGGATLG
jgi:hypothetical protein